MRKFRNPLALFVATVFFAAQVSACCMAVRDVASFLASAFRAAPAADPHACCPKPDAAPTRAASDCGTKACCIKDAGHKAPQLASAPAEVPDLTVAVAVGAVRIPASVLTAPAPSPSAADTGPPSLLRSVRILV